MTPAIGTREQPPSFSRLVTKPWGYERVFTPSNLPYAGKLLHVLGGHRLSLQVHPEKTETLVLLEGKATLLLDIGQGPIEFDMEIGAGYTIERGTIHRICALETCTLLEASTPEVGTTMRLEDDYGRPDETPAARDSAS